MATSYPNYFPQQMQYSNPYMNRPQYIDQGQQYQFSGLKGRPVASIDEVKASIIDFDGSIFYFPDTANKRIYTKQINLDGTSSLNVYSLIEQPVEQNQQVMQLPNNVVLKEEFDKTINVLVKEIEELKNKNASLLEKTKEEVKYNF